jgi:glycosyltransferase involved in cell wall biosynthesis
MRILQIGPNSVHLSSFISALQADQHEIYLLSEEACHVDGLISNFVVSFRTKNPIKILDNCSKIKNFILKINPEVIHIHQVNRLAFFTATIAQRLNIRIVTTAWGSDVLLIPQKNFLYRYLVTQTIKRSDIITADSNDMIEAMQRIAPSQKYKLLQYGIDPIDAVTKEKIIYSNRLHEPLYQIDKIVQYFADFSKTHPDWTLVVAGSGSETEKLKNLAKSLGLESKISFVGWQQKEENRAWYAKAAIYVSIPKSDGTSVSLLEAMSAGCLPVVADLPVSHEWIQPGKNGVIETVNVNPLFEAIKLNREESVQINADLIDQRATRAASMAVFMGLYAAEHG